jgi:hypothetical protein
MRGHCVSRGFCSIDVIAFSYQINDCDGSQNEQEGIVSCEDCGPFTTNPVIVMCLSGGGAVMTVSPMVVRPGEAFTVTNPNGSLPEILNRSISDGSGDKIQRDVINTSMSNWSWEMFGAFQVSPAMS